MDRLRVEAAFTHLRGAVPNPADSGETNRHRLHRGGDRSANRVLHIPNVRFKDGLKLTIL